MYSRHIAPVVAEALDDTPVVVLIGARQTGKSTLCQQLLNEGLFDAQLITFDDVTILAAAQTNPLAFLRGLGQHVILDEIQRVPTLLLSIKKLIDEDRQGRRFILTGSADVMVLPQVADSLAGRIEIHHLWPLSQDEIRGTRANFLTNLTTKEACRANEPMAWERIIPTIQRGGYPEAVAREKGSRRAKWFESYLLSVLQKDIRELANIEGLIQLPNVLHLLAVRVGSTLNMSDISRLSGIKNTTLKRYLALLEHVFLIVRIPAWTPNAEGQYVKSPKIYVNDTGLLSHLRGEDTQSLLENRSVAGAFLENFVVMEILKQLSWSEQSWKLYHFSIHKGAEVDLVLENKRKQLFGIEIKAAASLKEADFKGLKQLAALAPDKFRRGVVFYSGEQVVSFGDKLYAVPLSCLWQE